MTKHFRYRYSPIWAVWKAYVRETHPKNSLVRRSSLVPAFLVAPGFHSIVQIYGLKGPQKRQAKLCELFGRTSSFFNSPQEFFWKLHNVAIFLWPILLFLHGSQGWIGIGIPLVIVVSGLPIVLYALTRVARMLRTLGTSLQIFRWNHFFSGVWWGNERRWRYRQRERMRILNDYVPLVFYMEIWPIWPDVWWFIMIYIYINVCVCVDALSIASGFDVANISTINSLSLRWTRLQLNPPGYYCTGRSVKILRAVVRLGKDDAGQAIVFMFYFLLSTIYWMLFVWLIFFSVLSRWSMILRDVDIASRVTFVMI